MAAEERKKSETSRERRAGRQSYVTGVVATRKPRWSSGLLPHFGVNKGRQEPGPRIHPAFRRSFQGLGWAIDSGWFAT